MTMDVRIRIGIVNVFHDIEAASFVIIPEFNDLLHVIPIDNTAIVVAPGRKTIRGSGRNVTDDPYLFSS